MGKHISMHQVPYARCLVISPTELLDRDTCGFQSTANVYGCTASMILAKEGEIGDRWEIPSKWRVLETPPFLGLLRYEEAARTDIWSSGVL